MTSLWEILKCIQLSSLGWTGGGGGEGNMGIRKIVIDSREKGTNIGYLPEGDRGRGEFNVYKWEDGRAGGGGC